MASKKIQPVCEVATYDDRLVAVKVFLYYLSERFGPIPPDLLDDPSVYDVQNESSGHVRFGVRTDLYKKYKNVFGELKMFQHKFRYHYYMPAHIYTKSYDAMIEAFVKANTVSVVEEDFM